jgi:hypothetical protein
VVNVDLDFDSNIWFTAEAGKSFDKVPDAVVALLLEAEAITIGKSPKAKVEREAEGKPAFRHDCSAMSEKELTTQTLEDLGERWRIQCHEIITFDWLDAQGRFDGAHRLDTRKAVWIQKDVAEEAIKQGKASLCPWPIVGKPSLVTPKAFSNIGKFTRANVQEVVVGVEPGRSLAR